MNWLALTSALTISCLILSCNVLANHRMVKLHARQHHRSPLPGTGGTAGNVTQPPGKADPGLRLTQDSDGDLSLQHDETMRLMMHAEAESVIASHSGDSLSAYEVDIILSGAAPSLHPGALLNVSFTKDMFESGTTLPTTSSSTVRTFSKTFSSSLWSSTFSSDGEGDSAADAKSAKPDPDAKPNAATADERDLNHDGIISVDELLHSFFHADRIKVVFDQVQAETNKHLDKEGKKEIIKKAAPVLHKTIETVASHRGWGVQDARFAQLHLEGQQDAAAEAFKDYNTFVKTLRSALITPKDAAKDSAIEQHEAPRTDPATKA